MKAIEEQSEIALENIMPNWTRTIRLQPEWDQTKAGEITVAVMAGLIAVRLNLVRPLDDEELEETRQCLVEDFQDLARKADLDADAFDDLMSNLYDWGDVPLDNKWNGKKVCWIDTTRVPAVA